MLAVTNYFTKWVEIFAIPDQSTVTCAKIILNEVIARFGCPYDIHSDQGCNYESASSPSYANSWKYVRPELPQGTLAAMAR